MTRNQKYPVSYAAAITAASAVIGPIIPPSIPMVLYALISDASIGYLFLGGVIPGLLMALAQMVINTVMAHRRNFPVEKPIPLREWPGLTVAALPALLMPVILLGGIYSRSEAGIREEVERCRHQFASLAGCDIGPRSSPRG